MRRLLIVLAVVGLTLPGTAAASTTLTPRVTASSVVVRVTIANPGSAALRVPKASFLPQAFSVTRNGAPVAYVGPIAKTRPSDLVIPAHGRRTVTVDLSRAFAFLTTGRYVFALRGARASATIAARAVPEVRVGPSVPYTGCSAGEIAQIDQALVDARAYAMRAKDYFDTNRQGDRYTYWFGAYDLTRWTTVKSHFTAMVNVLTTSNAIALVCHDNDCTPGVYAFVYKAAHYTVYVCDLFWTAPATGKDSKAGTLIHEFSHFSNIGNTDDHFYGQTEAHLLAMGAYADPPISKGVEYAVLNADNHEYFAENTVVIGDNQSGAASSDAAHDFGAVQVGATATPKVISITNTGEAALTVGTVSVTGPFALTANACSSATVEPGAVCSLTVAFTAAAAGTATGSVAVPTNAATPLAAIGLAAVGVAPAPAPVVAASVPAPAPTPKVAAKAGRGSLTVTSDFATTILLQVKRGTKWVPVRTIAAKPGATVLKLKRGTYRVVTDPKGAAKPGAPIVVR